MPAQCYRYQDFYYHSRFCNRTPKCHKSAGSHETRDCKKTIQTPVKWALCGGSHPTNYSGCPKNPINAKHAKPPTVNVREERKKQQSRMAPNAPIIAQQTNNPLNPPLVDSMQQILNQMGSMLQIIQSQLTDIK
ncbi:nucleic-acid-binding protein from transposon X-element [Nephila pilipes]|uniref:Nucleic-acid-binding protein from transposon X-element n=1 Tax=Nephila pilipes TaxID=299642 RepID=A0A8X6NV32_NEPPI|nr:nucleic-acid-binding protein from transposon X-element [Nephila pilipes]